MGYSFSFFRTAFQSIILPSIYVKAFQAEASFLTGDAASLFLAAQRARLRARLDFCAMRASRFNCSLALITSASSVDTFLPSITRKPGVAGMFRAPWAARAAAVRRVTRGVERMLGGGIRFCCYLTEGGVSWWV